MIEASAFVIGVVVGTIGTLVGVGGGFMLVPIATFLEPKWSTAQITAYSLAVVATNGIAGAISYARQRRIDLKSFPLYAAFALPGSIVGAYVSSFTPRRVFDVSFGIVLMLLAAWLAFAPARKAGEGTGNAYRNLTDVHGTSFEWRFHMPLGLLGASCVGFLSSMLGIGGGVVHVPYMVAMLSYPEHIATATSQGVLAVTSTAGMLVHIVQGDYRHTWLVTTITCVGGLIGAPIGASLSRRVPGRALLRLLGIALLIVGARLFVTGLQSPS